MGEHRDAAFLEQGGAKNKFLGCMGKDDELYWLAAYFCDCRKHLTGEAVGDARIDNNNTVVAYNKSCVTDKTVICRTYLASGANEGIDIGSDFNRLQPE